MNCFKLLFISFCFVTQLSAKEVKPKVMVYGEDVVAFSAAIQSARSGVPTLWVVPSVEYCSDLFKESTYVSAGDGLIGGIWMNVLQEMNLESEKSDSLFNVTKRNLNPQLFLSALEKIAAKEINLKILKDVEVVKLIQEKKEISVALSNKSKFSFRAVVDASKGAVLKTFLKAETVFVDLSNAKDIDPVDPKILSGPIQYLNPDMTRTLLAINEYDKKVFGFTALDFITNSNLFFVSPMLRDGYSVNKLPLSFAVGQALGACASYCAFFKTTSDKMDVRKLQTELLNFEVRLLPYADVALGDPNFNALQRIFLVNLFPFKQDEAPYNFNGQDSVTVSEVQPVIQKLYSRAQLWFVDNESTTFTVKDAIELIKVLSFRGDELDSEIEKGWKRRFKFEREFSLSQKISRYEFAVLMDAYAEPFSKTVSLDGVIKR